MLRASALALLLLAASAASAPAPPLAPPLAPLAPPVPPQPAAWLAEAQAMAAQPDPERALELQLARLLGHAVDLDPPLPAPGPLREELAAVLALHGADRAEAAPLAALPPGLGQALALLLRAHRDSLALTEAAFAAGDRPDAALLAEAKVLLVRAVAAARPHLAPGLAPGFAVCGAVLLELEGLDSTHDCDYGFAVDLGGDDAWRNNAGGNRPGSTECSTVASASQLRHPTAAFALDLAGNDAYTGQALDGGVAGGGCDGLGALFELGGDDLYDVAVLHTGGGTGGANFGAGLLLDFGGDDTYRGRVARHKPGVPASGGLHGGANFGGHGSLLDLGGRDAYAGTVDFQGGLNGGENDGSGFLLDCGPEGDAYAGHVGISGGVNGGSSLGRGFLLDCGGDDTYAGSIGDEATFWQNAGTSAQPHGGVNGGAAAFSDGLLIDLAGDDAYAGEVWGNGGVNGGAFDGSGALLDAGGRDRYAGLVFNNGGVNGGAGRGGVALLLDASGDDVYDGTVAAARCELPALPELCGGYANGGGRAGVGWLLDGGGRDAYSEGGGPPEFDTSAVRGAGGRLDAPLP